MAERYIFTMRNLTKHFGKREVLKDVNLSFYPGAKIGVLGTNGSGKSTLLKIMAGVDKEYMGEAAVESGASVGYVPQEPHLTPGKTVLENMEEAVAKTRALLKRQEDIGDLMSQDGADFDKLMNEMDRVQAAIDAADAYNLDRQLELAMDAMRLPPPDAAVERLSGGERRRVALCKTLLQRPDLLLLDEPTNHLDAESVEWLERHLAKYPGAVVSVTHDRYFLDNVAKWILELDRGRGIPWTGNYSGWLEQKRKRLMVEEKQETARQKELERELEWAKMAPRARMSKSKARLANIDKLQAMEVDDADGTLQIQIPPGPMLGDLVVRAEKVAKSFGENLLYDDLTFNLPKGGIVGVIGPNGAGKTTLFKMIVGTETPDGGKLTVGPTVKAAHVDQNRDALDPDKSIFEEVTGGTGLHHARQPQGRLAGLRRPVQLPRPGPAEARRHLLRRRAEPHPPGQTPPQRRQLTPARRADQRPGRGHAPRPRRGPEQLRRVCGGHQPRPLVPRPHRHAHPGVRGRQQSRLVRGQFPGVRGATPGTSGGRRRRADAAEVPQAARVTSETHFHAEALRRGENQIQGLVFSAPQRLCVEMLNPPPPSKTFHTAGIASVAPVLGDRVMKFVKLLALGLAGGTLDGRRAGVAAVPRAGR